MFVREEIEENPAIQAELTELRSDTRELDHLVREELHEEHEELRKSLNPEQKQ